MTECWPFCLLLNGNSSSFRLTCFDATSSAELRRPNPRLMSFPWVLRSGLSMTECWPFCWLLNGNSSSFRFSRPRLLASRPAFPAWTPRTSPPKGKRPRLCPNFFFAAFSSLNDPRRAMPVEEPVTFRARPSTTSRGLMGSLFWTVGAPPAALGGEDVKGSPLFNFRRNSLIGSVPVPIVRGFFS